MPDNLTIAIDGPVASGKTVVGRMLARRIGCRFLDTGLMYRAATLIALEKGVDLNEDEAITNLVDEVQMSLDGESLYVEGTDVTGRLRTLEVERNVSRVSSIPGVRKALVRQQQRIAEAGPVVMVGRDIGTVVLPDADVKVYLDASVDVRAERRRKEFVEKGIDADLGQVRNDLLRRDRIDSERTHSPLKAADDALVIVTDGLGLDEVVEQIGRLVKSP